MWNCVLRVENDVADGELGCEIGKMIVKWVVNVNFWFQQMLWNDNLSVKVSWSCGEITSLSVEIKILDVEIE